MEKKKASIVILIIMGISVLLIGLRLFTKMVLVNELNMDSKALRVIADYSWGDIIEKEGTPKTENPSEKLQQFSNLYEEISSRQEQTSEESENILTAYKDKIDKIEENIEIYSGTKFMPYVILEKLNDLFDHGVGWSNVYARGDGDSFKLTNGSKYNAVVQSDMEQETALIDDMCKLANANNAQFLYVQRPYKTDENGENVPWGVSSYENENADTLLHNLEQLGIETLDLRSSLKEEKWNPETGFYISDGHWTVPTAFLATKCIASKLNTGYGFCFGKEFYAWENYDILTFHTNNSAAPDTVELMVPNYDTTLKYTDGYRGIEYEGKYDESVMDMRMTENARSTVLTIYSANRIRNSYLCSIENQLKTDNEKTVLILSDSFSWYIASFLALDTKEIIYSYYYNNPEAAEQIMEQLNPDVVIMMN